MFRFKQFYINDADSALKIGTDAVILGSYADVKSAQNILDVGSGCGIIALMLAQRINATVDAIEPDKGSAIDARENFQNSPWANRMQLYQERIQDFQTTKKYDLIVSNPPFFENDYKAITQERNFAKHDNSLRIQELFEYSSKLMHKNSSIEIIIAAHRLGDTLDIASKYALYLNNKLSIQAKENKEFHRYILRFSFLKTSTIQHGNLVIRDINNAYTEQYKALTRDFHLNL